MKTNLSKKYQTSRTLETEGAWMYIDENVAFKVRRASGIGAAKMQKEVSEALEPFSKKMKMKALTDDEQEKIAMKLAALTVMDWKGVEIDGEIAPFSREQCEALFCEFPDLAEEVAEFAQDRDNYKDEENLEELGN